MTLKDSVKKTAWDFVIKVQHFRFACALKILQDDLKQLVIQVQKLVIEVRHYKSLLNKQKIWKGEAQKSIQIVSALLQYTYTKSAVLQSPGVPNKAQWEARFYSHHTIKRHFAFVFQDTVRECQIRAKKILLPSRVVTPLASIRKDHMRTGTSIQTTGIFQQQLVRLAYIQESSTSQQSQPQAGRQEQKVEVYVIRGDHPGIPKILIQIERLARNKEFQDVGSQSPKMSQIAHEILQQVRCLLACSQPRLNSQDPI